VANLAVGGMDRWQVGGRWWQRWVAGRWQVVAKMGGRWWQRWVAGVVKLDVFKCF